MGAMAKVAFVERAGIYAAAQRAAAAPENHVSLSSLIRSISRLDTINDYQPLIAAAPAASRDPGMLHL